MNLINKAKSLISKHLIDVNIKVYFYINEEEYDVEQFKIGFSQHTDFKGEPQNETSGGQLMITLTQTLPESFYSWMIDDNIFKSGSILYKTGDSGTVLRIDFFNARCVNLSRQITMGKGVQSILVLSPEIVKLNGTEHDNFWIK